MHPATVPYEIPVVYFQHQPGPSPSDPCQVILPPSAMPPFSPPLSFAHPHLPGPPPPFIGLPPPGFQVQPLPEHLCYAPPPGRFGVHPMQHSISLPWPTHFLMSPPPPMPSPPLRPMQTWSPSSTMSAPLSVDSSPSQTSASSPGDSTSRRQRQKTKKAQEPGRIGPMVERVHQFRNTQDRIWSLREIEGTVAEFCRDKYGSRFVQEDLRNAPPVVMEMVFQEVMESGMKEMSQHIFGNYVVQIFLECGTSAQQTAIFDSLFKSIYELSLHIYGCRVVQKLLDVVSVKRQAAIVKSLEPHVLECVTNAHANHVIQKIFEVVPAEHVTFLTAFRGHVIHISQHSYGCRVIQRCFEYLPQEKHQPILEEFMEMAHAMVTDQFGNYIVQYLLQSGSRRDKDFLMSLIRGRVVGLSSHKHASNVCEVALMHSQLQTQKDLIDEILVVAEGGSRPAVWKMIYDPYGNYVLQRALRVATGPQKRILFDAVDQQLRHAWSLGPSETVYRQLTAIDRVLKCLIPTFLDTAPPSSYN